MNTVFLIKSYNFNVLEYLFVNQLCIAIIFKQLHSHLPIILRSIFIILEIVKLVFVKWWEDKIKIIYAIHLFNHELHPVLLKVENTC